MAQLPHASSHVAGWSPSRGVDLGEDDAVADLLIFLQKLPALGVLVLTVKTHQSIILRHEVVSLPGYDSWALPRVCVAAPSLGVRVYRVKLLLKAVSLVRSVELVVAVLHRGVFLF